VSPEELRAFRESLELSRREFAPKLFISEPTLERWERGQGGPREIHLQILRRMREHLSSGHSISYFQYDSSGEPTEPPPDDRRTITEALKATGALLCGKGKSKDGSTWTLSFRPDWPAASAVRISLTVEGSFRPQRPSIDFTLNIESDSLNVGDVTMELTEACLAHGMAWGPLGRWKRPAGLVLCQRIFSPACSPVIVQHLLGNMRSCWESVKKSLHRKKPSPRSSRGKRAEAARAPTA
jgi:transcriptional regulator with XRE-family HTH domain